MKTKRAKYPAGLFDELVIDNFAGGGGASLGIERAVGRAIDLAINHDREALAMHLANHPHTRHLCEDVWHVDPVEACGGRPVGLAWFSPDCKHFSRAKGGKPVEKRIRGLAWVVVRWAKTVRPRVICLENVREFQEWGPLTAENLPDPGRKGLTFRRWVGCLRNLGYAVEWRVLNAADFGAPTHRRRLFIVARCDGRPICWPQPTHGPGRKAYRTAAECIDWSIPCPSIFDRKRPLAEKTMRRIALGLKRFVLENPRPFIVTCNHAGEEFRGQSIGQPMCTLTGARDAHGIVVPHIVGIDHQGSGDRAVWAADRPLGTVTAEARHALVAAWMVKHYGGVVGHELDRPVGTVTAKDHHGLAAVHLSKFYGTNVGSDPGEPLPTITGGGQHIAAVYAFLVKYFGTAVGQAVSEPLHTATGHDRFGLVVVRINGEPYVLADVGLRMLTPRELARAQGFPDSYVLTGSKSSQVARIGNSVPPVMAERLAEVNYAAELAAATA
jgi:DNA (cytosine-5)-methyltransferase 1